MESDTIRSSFKHVFVCGLHRSGTTVLARDIARFRDCTAFQNTGALMDEGQYLQEVYPTDNAFGGAGKFGFASQAHLTETSPLLTPAHISRLQQSWEKYWEAGKPVRIEKTPGNLLMTRFLQAAFENACFVVIKRHPLAVSLATRKWSRTSLASLFEHWLRCHAIFDEDKTHLRRVYELKYEDYVRDPGTHLKRIADFVGVERPAVAETSKDYNRAYFEVWTEMLQKSRYRAHYRQVASMFEERFAVHGYSLAGSFDGRVFALGPDTAMRRLAGAPARLAAGAYAMYWRKGSGLKSRVRGTWRGLRKRMRSNRPTGEAGTGSPYVPAAGGSSLSGRAVGHNSQTSNETAN